MVPVPAVCMQMCLTAPIACLPLPSRIRFEIFPFYNDNMHVMDRCLFMNNYGIRTTVPDQGFHTWNWNAPLWLGLNTINVNGQCILAVVARYGHAYDGEALVSCCFMLMLAAKSCSRCRLLRGVYAA